VFSIPLESTDIGMRDASLAKVLGVVFFASYAVFYNPLTGRKCFPPIPLALKWFYVYVIVYLVSSLFADSVFAWLNFTRIATLIQLLTLVWILTSLLQEPNLMQKTLIAYATAAAVLAVAILLVPGVGVSGASERMTALREDQNYLACMMALAALIVIGLSVQNRTQPLIKILLLVSTVPLLWVIVMTGSRTGAAAFLIGGLVYIVFYGKSRQSGTLIVLATLGITTLVYLISINDIFQERWKQAYYDRDFSRREAAIAVALEMIPQRPLFGWQPGVSFEEIGRRVAVGDEVLMDTHNLLLNLLIEVGVVGAIPFLVGLWLCVRAALLACKGDLGHMPLAVTIAAIMASMGIPILYWKSFWLPVAIALASGQHQARDSVRERSFGRVAPMQIVLRSRSIGKLPRPIA
jgi:O-antigen ligase